MSKRTRSFISLVFHSLTELWINARSVAVSKMIFLTFFWGSLVIAGNVLAMLFRINAQMSGLLGIGVVLFFILMTATWIVVAYEQTKTEFTHPEQTPRALIAGILAIIPTYIIAVLLTWSVSTYALLTLSQPLHPPVTNFTSCVKAGGVVLQTSPQQCVTTDGTFTEGQ